MESLIDFSEDEIVLCMNHYACMSDMLYAVASTGGLFRGNRRPPECETDEEWDAYLVAMFAIDLRAATRDAAKYVSRLYANGRSGKALREAKADAKRLAMFSLRIRRLESLLEKE